MKERNRSGWMKAGWLLFYLYIVLLSYFLFFSEHYGRDYVSQDYRYNLVLFKEIKRFIEYRQQLGLESFVVNIMGNVLAFAPFGFLLPMLNKRYRGFFTTTFLSFFFSLAVELVQMYFKVGIFDVDDIFMNTVGGILGYISYRIFHALFLRSGKKNKKSRRK